MSTRLDQFVDVNGSRNQTSNMNVENEPLKIGSLLSNGSGATLSSSILYNVNGISNKTCSLIRISNSTYPVNNGIFQITEKINSNTVRINNPSAVDDINLIWEEFDVYTLESDLNYERSDRENIKGVPYYQQIPTYNTVDNQSVQIPANLLNISGNTTDAKAIVINKKHIQNITITTGSTYTTITNVGNLKHSNPINLVGVPVFDGYNYDACFVALIKDGYTNELTVLGNQVGGATTGMRIFGLTRAGSSVSPNSVEIEFRAVNPGDNIQNSVLYTWEVTQSVEIYYGYRDSLNSIADTAFRTLMVNGVVFGGSIGSGGSDSRLPAPTSPGQILMSHDGIIWEPTIPIVNNDGAIVVDEDGHIVGTIN
jgi:hypothetical protein